MTKKNKQTNKSTVELKTRIDKLAKYIEHHRGDVKALTVDVNQTPSTSGVVTYLTPCAQGDNASDRAGMRINSQYLEFSMSILATLTSNVRIIIVRDTMGQGVTPSVTNILATATVYSPKAYFSAVTQKRFVWLLDRTYNNSVAGKLSHHDSVRINDPVITHFTGTGATDASGAKNVYYMLVITDVAAASTTNTYVRTIFTDE